MTSTYRTIDSNLINKWTILWFKRKELLELEDRICKVCILYGEGKINEDEFNKYTGLLNMEQNKILNKYFN